MTSTLRSKGQCIFILSVSRRCFNYSIFSPQYTWIENNKNSSLFTLNWMLMHNAEILKQKPAVHNKVYTVTSCVFRAYTYIGHIYVVWSGSVFFIPYVYFSLPQELQHCTSVSLSLFRQTSAQP